MRTVSLGRAFFFPSYSGILRAWLNVALFLTLHLVFFWCWLMLCVCFGGQSKVNCFLSKYKTLGVKKPPPVSQSAGAVFWRIQFVLRVVKLDMIRAFIFFFLMLRMDSKALDTYQTGVLLCSAISSALVFVSQVLLSSLVWLLNMRSLCFAPAGVTGVSYQTCLSIHFNVCWAVISLSVKQ